MLRPGLLVLAVFSLFGTLMAALPVTKPSAPPATKTEKISEEQFGTPVADPYRWLEDEKSPEVKAWMDAQDQYARAALQFPGRETLVKRLRSMLYIDAVSSPHHAGSRFFYSRRHADKEKSIVYWKEGETGAETVLLDPNTMSTDGTVSLGTWEPTHDGLTVAYAIRRNNSDEATLHVMDVATGKVSEKDVIEGAKYADPQWTPDGQGFYYTFLPALDGKEITVDARPGFAEVRFHALGTDPAKDPVVHPRTADPATFISPSLSRDGRWLFVYIAHGWNANDVYYRDLQSKDTTWKPFVVGKDSQYSIIAWRDQFYVATNEGAPKWRVFKTAADKPARDEWREIVPEAETTLDSTQIVGEHLVLVTLKDASSRMEVRTLEGKLVRTVPLPSIGTTGGMSGNPDEDDAYFGFVSFMTPSEVYRTSIKTGETKLWASVKVPFDASPYEVQQVWYPSRDGTKVSMFLLHKKGLKKDGNTPWLLTGYGGFNVSMTPSFSVDFCLWLEAGGGVALPNLRGGGEYGEAWHRAGMLHNKQNVFDDFIAAAEYLIKSNYTKPEKLAIRGGSNGGLLVGAAMTQRPELFKAVICAVPLLDMVRYHKFGSGRTWIPEYGTAEKAEDFKVLHGYSPYHHIHPDTKYPALLMISADSDDRVDPMHARKFAAGIQAASTSGLPVLLRIEKNAGHGGADLIKQRVEASADSIGFLVEELGAKAP